jgi:outer membrane protein TolC
MLKLKFITAKILVPLLLLISFQIKAQFVTSLSIDSCYSKARRNFPMVKQFDLIEKTRNYSLDNVSKGYLPQLNIAGQATYQSDVTQPTLNTNLPGVENTPLFQTISKDQYKIYGEVVQPVTDLFILNNQKELVKKNAEVETQKLEVELYKLREHIDQVFFGILLIDQQITLVELMKKDIQTGIDKTNAAITNGIALKNNLYLLQAEMLKADQRTTELAAARKSYTDVLSLFIAQPINENTVLEKPATPRFSTHISRPELEMFEIQKQVFGIQGNIVNTRNLPRFSLFVQSGVGRPALNMLSNDLNFFYLGGLRLNWSLSNFYTSRKEKEILGFNQSSMDLQKETFLFNTNLAVKQQFNEVAKIEALINTDSQIIELRENIKTTAQSQLLNGVISASDYVTFLNAEDQARQNLLLHQTQLLMVLYNNRTTTGN